MSALVPVLRQAASRPQILQWAYICHFLRGGGDADLRYTHSQRGPMRQITFFGALLATALELSVPALAQSGESAAGRRLARELCGDCHQARRPFPLLYRYPPSFEDIAGLSSTTRLSLKVFLRSNHEQMPNFIISKSDTDPIIEYILSLKRQ